MKCTRTSLLRRVVMWAAGVVLVVSVGACAASLFRVGWQSDDGAFNIEAEGGFLIVFNHASPQPPTGWRCEGVRLHLRWWPRSGSGFWSTSAGHPSGVPRLWMVYIPLWMPLLASGLALWSTFLIGRTARLRTVRGLCPTCRYDLTGITGPCPECGKEREA